MATRRKRRTVIPVARSRDYSLLWRLLPAWILPSVSPVYEIWLVKQTFPIALELFLLALVFIYCIWVCGIKRVGLACWFAACAVFGAVAFINILLGLSGFSSGKPILGLMIFLLCAGITWTFAVNFKPEQTPVPESSSFKQRNAIEWLIACLAGAFGLWITASLFDALLVDRLFFYGSQTETLGLWVALLIFGLSLIAQLYEYSRDPNGSRFRKIFMPIAISFLVFCVSVIAFSYGMVFAIHALAVGQKRDIVYIVKKLERDPTRRSMCPYSAVFGSLDGRLSHLGKCITARQYQRLKIGDQIPASSLVTRFGALVVSPSEFLNTNPQSNAP